jgi:hypothetical protein
MELREGSAQRADARGQGAIENVSDHHHAGAHPLAMATERGVAERRHAAAAMQHGSPQCRHRLLTEAVRLRRLSETALDCCSMDREFRLHARTLTMLLKMRPA